MKNKILLFADGASKGNPGPAGWGALTVHPQGQVVELGGAAPLATNNQMELQAVISGLRSLAATGGEALVLTDSSYVISGVKLWMPRWQRNGWKTTTGEPVRNQDLWQDLAAVLAQRRAAGFGVSWQHVPGHAGVAGNERVDRIAHLFAVGEGTLLYEGPLQTYGFDPYELATNVVQESKKNRSRKPAYSYLSLLNGVLATHKTWADCEARVKGQKGAKFKKALSREEEQAIISSWRC